MALVALLAGPALILPAGLHFSVCLSHNDAPCHDAVDVHVADTCGDHGDHSHEHHHTPAPEPAHDDSGCCPHYSGLADSGHCLDLEWIISEDPLQFSRLSVELPDAPVALLDKPTYLLENLAPEATTPAWLRQSLPPPSPPSLVMLQRFRC